MSPDPSRQSDERRSSIGDAYVTVAVNISENDDDDISYEGYEILPQDLNQSHAEPENVEFEDSNSEEEEDVQLENVTPSNFDQSMKIELTELWNSGNNRIIDIQMDSKKEEEIKSAMASFKLPSTSIPTWAKNIPEEQWKQQILEKINSSRTT